MSFRLFLFSAIASMSAFAGIPNNPDVRVDKISADEAVVKWEADGIDTDGFYLEIRKNDYPDDFCKKGDDVGNVSKYKLTGLRNNQTYGVRVCAYNDRGKAGRGSRVLFITKDSKGYSGKKPDYPNNPDVYAEYADANEAGIKWVADGINTEYFLIERREGDYPDNECKRGRDVGDVRSTVLRRLKPNTTYGVRVCPVSPDGKVSAGSRIMIKTGR